MRLRQLAYAAAGLLALAGLASCSDDIFSDDTNIPQGNAQIRFLASDMIPQYIDPTQTTRAAGPKDEEEKRINTIHLFFFDKTTGELITTEFGNLNGYQKFGNSVFEINEEALGNLENVTMVAIANIDATDNTGSTDPNRFLTPLSEDGKIASGSRTGAPCRISRLQDIMDWVYAPKLRVDESGNGDITRIPDAGMPMIAGPKTFTADEIKAKRIIVDMVALMARVDVSIDLDPNQTNGDRSLPTMTVESFGVKNMPKTVPFTMPAGDNASTDVAGEEKLLGEFTSPCGKTVTADSEPLTFTYYTYENIQQPDRNAVRPDGTNAFDGAGNLTFPDGVLTGNKDPLHADNIGNTQRWKPTIAKKEEASALVINGSYTTHQGLNYKAKFTIYMGADPVQDFKVERNHRYNNYVTIHGLDYVRNTDDNTYTFDGRVNVKTDNPLYLAIVNERKVDAHATALPMDVWLLLREPAPDDPEQKVPEVSHYSTVTVTIPEEARSWMRLVMVPRAEMEKGGFNAGTGAERYFYTDLFSRIDNKSILAGHEPGAQCGYEVTVESTPELNNSRSRVYFYIDENVPTGNNPANYGDRMARVGIKYERRNAAGELLEPARERVLEIEQRALIHVIYQANNRNINTWMEQYEEYMDHQDPLDKHVQPGEYYTGLPWAKAGTELANGATNSLVSGNSYDIYDSTEAIGMTRAVLGRSGAVAMNSVLLFNEEAPATAFHYCAGKNKRNAAGNVDFGITGWYMPGITELEGALRNNYTTFPEFHTPNLYWSASAGKYSGPLSSQNGELNDRARATGIKSDGSYEESKSDRNGSFISGYTYSHPNGSRLRTESLRIRAFYKAE